MIDATISDDRLEVLRDAYDHLVGDRFTRPDIVKRDQENLSIIRELQFCRSKYCPDCRGCGWVANPDAQWARAEDGADYCNGPEEIDCPTCNGVGFQRPRPVYTPPAERDDGMPF